MFLAKTEEELQEDTGSQHKRLMCTPASTTSITSRQSVQMKDISSSEQATSIRPVQQDLEEKVLMVYKTVNDNNI